MCFPASDIIAAKWPQWEAAIKQIDQLLFLNASKLVRADFVGSFVEDPNCNVAQILKEYAKLQAIEFADAKCCPRHADVLLDPMDRLDSLYCDLCDETINGSELTATSTIRIKMPQTTGQSQKAHVFVSHSSLDKDFVRTLVKDLSSLELNVFFDEQSIGIGDSIPQEISKALAEADYVIIVMSPNSVESEWVKQELDATLMSKNVLILPILIKDCDVPVLLKGRRFADFRQPENYSKALAELASALRVEQSALPTLPHPGTAPCSEKLSELSNGELRRRIASRLNRSELSNIWWDLTNETMDDEYPKATMGECARLLIDKVMKRNQLDEFLKAVCAERPDLVNPT